MKTRFKSYLSMILAMALLASLSLGTLTACSSKLRSMPTRDEQKALEYPDPEWEETVNREHYKIDGARR